MTYTIAISFRSRDKKHILPYLDSCAVKYNFEFLLGLDSGDPDVVPGLQNFLREWLSRGEVEKFDHVFFIKTSENKSAALAFSIYKQLRSNQGATNGFFDFLDDIEKHLKSKKVDLLFVFCGEFSPTDEVRFLSGTIKELKYFLSLPELWTLHLWSPKCKLIQESDRYPVAFLVSEKT